ncbi:MAG: hypothetical protein GC187_07130 [Alphaproteobacteria bacterium]|nr:hypothetical protein [Alphaproteobacteria bacterium]
MSDIVTLAAVLLGSALAIALVIGLNAMLGGWAPSRIDSAGAAAQALERDILGFRAGAQGVAAADRRAGLVMEADGGRLGLALSLGDGIVSRALRPAEVRGAQAQGERLVIRIDDFTLQRACITLANEDEARLWAGRITRFARGEPQEI